MPSRARTASRSSPGSAPFNHAGYPGKDGFTIDLGAHDERGSGTCPGGVTATEHRAARDGRGRRVPECVCPLAVCRACPLAERCLGGPAGRVAHPVRPHGRRIQLHSDEAALPATRAAHRTPEQPRALRERLRPRAKIERKIADVLRRHGLRHGRYLGRPKTDLQAVLTATMVNAERPARLAAADPQCAARLRCARAEYAGRGLPAPSPTTVRRLPAAPAPTSACNTVPPGVRVQCQVTNAAAS